ncbi:phosphatidate cytidylyltransferase [Carboxylicivirga sp. N1Y90]|uniref:phosphatidate cytidylyltransferase n=1 Tax=Carboxylicivirga fragile TaxID=3417571 RepID=UPI003D3501F0|nr:phosphatidate cytidylyltransferase [Marinilabiliaceae bacterium N1Y90]
MNNFLQRSLTGVIFVGSVVGTILFHPLAFFILCLLVSVLGMIEMKRLLERRYDRINLFASLLLGLSFQVLVFLDTQEIISNSWYIILMPMIWLPFVHELFKGGEHPFQRIALTLLLPVYIAIPLSFLYLSAWTDGTFNNYFLIAFFAMVWCNDTGAYLVGVSIGRHKLYERISPKKTWEGFIGGVIFTALAAFVIFRLTDIASLWVWIAAGLIVSVFGTLGDLIESMLKRNVDIKDSGAILPGHGGILDRFDAVLFAAPMVFALFILFG